MFRRVFQRTTVSNKLCYGYLTEHINSYSTIDISLNSLLMPPCQGGSEGPSYVEMAKEAVTNALADARVSFDAVEAAVRLCTISTTHCISLVGTLTAMDNVYMYCVSKT